MVTSSLIVVPQDHDWERQVEQVQQVVDPLFIDRPTDESLYIHSLSAHFSDGDRILLVVRFCTYYHLLSRTVQKEEDYTAEYSSESYRISAILSHSNASKHSTNCMMLRRQTPVSCNSFSLL